MLTKLDWAKLEEAIGPAREKAVDTVSIEHRRRSLAIQLLKIRTEALRLYVPLPYADVFHRCNAVWRLIDGSNRSGKTIACSVEIARAMTGQDPYDKYPKKNGLALFAGLNWNHMGLLYGNLFREGALKKIRDEHTGLWRAVTYKPDKPEELLDYDEAYREKWHDAPPLIPERFIKHISWNDYGKGYPKIITLNNGWESLWFSGEGKPDQGRHYNLVALDEEMPDGEIYKEAHRGMTRLHESKKRRPKGIWSATSQISNNELADLRDKADADPESDFVRRFNFTIDKNPYVPREAKEEFKAGLSGEDLQTRYYGIASMETRRIYPKYEPNGDAELGTGHGCEPFPIDPLQYTRYIILDPSVTHCATLLIAIDRNEQYKTVYDGFDINGATARMWAKELKERENGVKFECCYIDSHFGKQTPSIREETTVAREYFEAMKEVGIQLRQYGPFNGFFPACDNREARIMALNTAMEVRGGGPFEGTCELRVMRGIVPELDKQIRRAQTDPKNPKKWLKNPKIPMDFCECHDEETEVLERLKGWIKFSQLRQHDRVATVDLDTDTIVFQKPQKIIAQEYEGDLIYFSGHKMDIAVTPGHRMVVERFSYDFTASHTQFCNAENLKKYRDRLKLHSNWRSCNSKPIVIPAAKNGGYPEQKIDRGLFAEFLGWYLAEGSYTARPRCPGKGYRIHVAQKKPHGKDELRNLLKQLPWIWNERKDGFTCSCKQLWNYLKQFGRSKDKYVPQWVKNSDADTIRRFIRGAIAGDGTVPKNGAGRQYYTISKKLADDMQELFIKSGVSAAVTVKKTKDGCIRGRVVKSNYTVYTVAEWKHPHAGLVNHSGQANFRRKHYAGMVYCATVPNGTLITRRNGRPVISGNCLEYSTAATLPFVEPEKIIPEDEKRGPTVAEIFKEKLKRRQQRMLA